MFPVTELATPRLKLVPMKPEHVRAFTNGREALSVLLGVGVPGNWPVDPVVIDTLSLRMENASAFDWPVYFYIHKEDGTLIGDGGFKGPPDAGGRIELGYSVIPEYRGKGLATEAAGFVVDWAFSNNEIQTVCAETSVAAIESMHVLRTIGMIKYAERHDKVGEYLFCWQIRRNEYEEIRKRRAQKR